MQSCYVISTVEALSAMEQWMTPRLVLQQHPDIALCLCVAVAYHDQHPGVGAKQCARQGVFQAALWRLWNLEQVTDWRACVHAHSSAKGSCPCLQGPAGPAWTSGSSWQ